jgi:hypothetical protein
VKPGENPVTILEELAEYCRTAGEFTSAIAYYHKILGLAERASRSSGVLASTCRKLAGCLLDAGNPDAALGILSRPEADQEDDEDVWGRAATSGLRARSHRVGGRL